MSFTPAVTTIHSPVGPLKITATEKGIISITFAKKPGRSDGQHPILKTCAQQLKEYFAGKRRTFTVPLAPAGTAFQRKVWDQLLTIPCGETLTYGQVASRIRKDRASRAVGNAVGSNPIVIIIPCHRILAGNGMGGFSGGIKRKEWLLEHENTMA